MAMYKARSVFSMSKKLTKSFFYNPGERQAGPMALFVTLDKSTGVRGVFSIKQGSRFVLQNGLAPVTGETSLGATGDASPGPFTFTLAATPAPGSLKVTTADDSGFSGAGEGAGLKHYIDDGSGVLRNSAGVARGTVNYFTRVVVVTFAANVTLAAAINSAYSKAVNFKEGVKLITLSGFEKEKPLEFYGVCESGTLQGWTDLVGQWM